jgi:endonuclease/exonuclease/phosphatase family metal-dependent hydrolase
MHSLKILTLNVGLLEIDLPLLRKITLIRGKSIRMQAIMYILRQHTHDIVLLQEVGVPAQKQLIEGLSDVFPYHITHHAKKLFSSNLLILSKIPFSHTTFIPYTAQTYFESWGIQKGMLCGSIQWNHTDYHIINTHLVASGTDQRDTSSDTLAIRDDQINQIKSYINETYQSDDHVIIGGDFNMGPQTSEENYHNIITTFKDCMEHIHRQSRITWSPKNPLVRSRVINDPEKQIDGFYMKHHHYTHLEKNIELNRMFLDEISFEYNGNTQTTMISDHYGVELIIHSNTL